MGACPSCAPEAGRSPPDWEGVRARIDPTRGSDAARTYCPHCARLYPADAAHCPRCPSTALEEKGGTCPRCGGALAPHAMGSVSSDRCGGCGGSWFDRGEVQRALDLTVRGEAPRGWRRTLPKASGPPEAVRYVPCVRCGERMARRLVAPLSGVIVDVCRHHGLWFDAGEWERFEAFVAADGLQAAREAEARAPALSAPPPPPPPLFGPLGPLGSHGGALPSALGQPWLPVLADLLFRTAGRRLR
jgi:Zn-finger nucleic acid-binding protein